MTWIGTWKNQYGSVFVITDDTEGRIAGTFRTALKDSSFLAMRVAVSGIHRGDCINFAFATTGHAGDSLASFTGLRRNDKIATMWFVVSDGVVASSSPPKIEKRSWSHAVMTNADTFERIIYRAPARNGA